MARAEARDARDASAERLRSFKLAQEDVERLRTETEHLRADLVGRTEQTAEARGALAVANTQLTAAAQQAEQNSRVAAAAEARAAQLREHLSVATQRGDRLAVEFAAAKVQIAEVSSRAAISEERATHALDTTTTATRQLTALQDEHRALQAAHAVSVRDAQQHANAFAQLRGAHKELEAVRQHLLQMKEERDAAARDRDNLLRHPPALVQRLTEIEALLRRVLGDSSA